MDTPRIMPPNEMSDVLAMSLAIMSICSDEPTDAVAILPGMGEEKRIALGVRLWACHTTARKSFLLVAGANQTEKTFEKLDAELLGKRYYLTTWPTENIHTIIHTKNTLEQADWLKNKTLELKIKSLTLCTSSYHMVRAYLTVLKTFIKADILIPILPYLAYGSLEAISPEVGKPQWDLIPGELE